MLQLTKRLQEGISLVNTIDISKINGVLGRVCAALCAGSSQVFTEEEEEKLNSSLGLTPEQTKTVIHTVVHIIQQAAHNMVRPALLEEHLAAAGITQNRVQIFTEHWITNAKPIVDKLRQQNLSEKQLEDVAWELHLETASSNLARQSRPIAHLQLNLSSGTDASKLEAEKVSLQFDHDQLYQLYDQLEQIQSHLDALR
ncbi:COMM domain-containing protein 10 [Procambarus clarkii]|uniref:COMM domain-containing protein 10 n=1 Tax=Procambarus clarkii TaxID=6728 RepID=UPI001E6710EF|nr:COMM domain-containing protein 10-like [Procambarus clarkii]XP_045582945.1 COMM domain-containing protein 10-like [Procambarus clarkii]